MNWATESTQLPITITLNERTTEQQQANRKTSNAIDKERDEDATPQRRENEESKESEKWYLVGEYFILFICFGVGE